MTQNGLIYLKAVDIKSRTQQIQYVYNIYAILYSFYNKRAFSNFWRNGPKSISLITVSSADAPANVLEGSSG